VLDTEQVQDIFVMEGEASLEVLAVSIQACVLHKVMQKSVDKEQE
jgi:hypothetical protein